MSSNKQVQVITSLNMDDLASQINAIMEADANWGLITIDSQEVRNIGIQQVLYKAWLQYDNTGSV